MEIVWILELAVTSIVQFMVAYMVTMNGKKFQFYRWRERAKICIREIGNRAKGGRRWLKQVGDRQDYSRKLKSTEASLGMQPDNPTAFTYSGVYDSMLPSSFTFLCTSYFWPDFRIKYNTFILFPHSCCSIIRTTLISWHMNWSGLLMKVFKN